MGKDKQQQQEPNTALATSGAATVQAQAEPEPAQQAAPEAPANVVALPAPYGVAQFSRPDREVTAKRGGTLVTRVRLTIPAAGLAVDAAVWANPRKDGGRDYSVSLPSYVRATEPLVAGSKTDNATTGAVKDAIITAWWSWFKANAGQTAQAETKPDAPAAQFGRFTPPAE